MLDGEFEAIFSSLKECFHPYESAMIVKDNDERDYALYTHHIMKNKQNLYFGGVNIKKNYVSLHIMPLYVNPSLCEALSPELKKKMHGKSCFNFKNKAQLPIPAVKRCLAQGFEYYQAQDYI